jgi:hypothetical protein
MKFKSVRIKIKGITANVPDDFEIQLYGGYIIADVSKLRPTMPSLGVDFSHYTEITGYLYSPATEQMFNGDFNTCILYNNCYNGVVNECQIFTKLNFVQRNKLYLMMGDHFILNNGNFKWLVGIFLTVVFFFYQAKQNDKLVQANKDLSSLKDSLNKYQNLTKLK